MLLACQKIALCLKAAEPDRALGIDGYERLGWALDRASNPVIDGDKRCPLRRNTLRLAERHGHRKLPNLIVLDGDKNRLAVCQGVSRKLGETGRQVRRA